VAVTPPICDCDWPAPEFSLQTTDGKTYALADLRSKVGTQIVFVCNRCPYVLEAIDRIVRDAKDLQALGVGVAAICSGDAVAYPADGFPQMKKLAEAEGFAFPYLHDEDQSVARAYGAACTPDFFGFNTDLGLQYWGWLNARRAQAGPVDLRRDLFEAMSELARTGCGPADRIASIGCSIEWKAVLGLFAPEQFKAETLVEAGPVAVIGGLGPLSSTDQTPSSEFGMRSR